jgi:DNA primase
MGLCPLHADHKPSFLVDPIQQLFYCYGCGRGGDVIRFVELYHQLKFPQALALLQQWRGLPSLLRAVTDFYLLRLHCRGEAVAYLTDRGLRSPELIERMQIGYAPGRCLRRWLTQLGYSLPYLQQAGLVTTGGYDAFVRRLVFPLECNLYRGDACGWVHRTCGYLLPHPRLEDFQRDLLTEPAYRLEHRQREVVPDAIASVCQYRGWQLIAYMSVSTLFML